MILITPKITNLGYSNLWTDMSTILGYASNLAQQIQKLFANGEQGFFYDPNDLTILYQDVAGTIPVTAAGQPVGLMLDKSKGLVLGSELVVNNEFDTPASWVLASGMSISSGKLNIAASVGGSAFQTVALKQAGWYIVKLKVDSFSGSDFTVRFLSGSTVAGNFLYKNTAGEAFWIVRASTAFDKVVIQCGGGAGVTAIVDSISVKELHGNPAYQSTSAARPILRNTPRRIDFDAVDDKLTTTFPAQLTGCTVVRSVPNVGTQILTGQTIPATYEDNTDHCGLLVINRALTASETSYITRLFNKSAGV